MTKKELSEFVRWWGVVISFGLWLSFFVSQFSEESFVWWDAIFAVVGAACCALPSWFSVALLVGGWMFGSIP